MKQDPQQAALCVREAMLNLWELVDKSTSEKTAIEKEELRREAEETTLGLIAAIIAEGGKYDVNEHAFLSVLVDTTSRPGGDLSFILEYGERWRTSPPRVPRFFQAAIDHDAIHGSESARSMLLEIQLLGNNTCASDGRIAAREQDVIRKYLTFLDAHLERSIGK